MHGTIEYGCVWWHQLVHCMPRLCAFAAHSYRWHKLSGRHHHGVTSARYAAVDVTAVCSSNHADLAMLCVLEDEQPLSVHIRHQSTLSPFRNAPLILIFTQPHTSASLHLHDHCSNSKFSTERLRHVRQPPPRPHRNPRSSATHGSSTSQ